MPSRFPQRYLLKSTVIVIDFRGILALAPPRSKESADSDLSRHYEPFSAAVDSNVYT